MKIKRTFRKLVSLLTVLVILAVTAMPSFAAVAYPEGVTKEQAYQAIFKFDSVISYVLKQKENKTLRELAEPMIYSDEVLSKILVGVYTAVEENADSLGVLGLETSTADVAKHLGNYGDVAQKLASYPSWSAAQDFTASWGVTNKADFAFAVSLMFTPFNEVLYALLCSGKVSIGTGLFLNIQGSNGYETAIIPTLEALGCKNITQAADFYAHAEENKSYMVYHIVNDVLTFAEGVLDAPCDRLTDELPSIAYFTNNGGLENALSTLLQPLKLQLLGIATLADFETLISQSEDFTQNFAVNINDILSTLGFGLENIDFDLIASCGTVSGNRVIADKADVFMVILRWIIDSARLNESTLNEEVSGMNFLEKIDLSTVLAGVMDKTTDEIISILINLMTQTASRYNDYVWTFPQFVQTQVAYTENLNPEKLQRVVDGIDGLINEFVAETDPTATFYSLMQKEIYSSKTLSLVMKELFSAFEKEEMAETLSFIGYDFSVGAVADSLAASGYSAASAQLRNCSKWSDLDTENFRWGFAEGDREGFVSCISCILRPFEDALKMILCEGNIKLFGAIDIYGSNGYNSALIPLYEALGCKSESICTYEEFKAAAASGNIIRTVLNPICDLIDEITLRPVYTLTGILPNVIYFMDSGLFQCLTNLVYPFEDVFEALDIQNSLGLGYIDPANLSSMLGEAFPELDLGLEVELKLPALDIKSFAGMGTLVSAQSKRVTQGQYSVVSYVQADRNAVMMALMRYLVQVIKTPGNEGLMDSLMSSALSNNAAVATFAQNIKTELAAKTENETIEWIYQLFFRERVTVDESVTEEYIPQIKYEEEKDYKKTIFTVIIIYVCLEIIYFFNRKKIREVYGRVKENVIGRLKKKEEEE